MIDIIPSDILQCILSYSDGRTISTFHIVNKAAFLSTKDNFSRFILTERLRTVSSIVAEHLPTMHSFVNSLIKLISTAENEHSMQQCSVWLSLLDYFEHGIFVSPAFVNPCSGEIFDKDLELRQWPVWCDDINYFLNLNNEEAINKRIIITTPCWDPCLFSLDERPYAAASDFLDPFPAPAGRAYFTEPITFREHDNPHMHNIMSASDGHVITLPVKVVQKQDENEILTDNTSNLPFTHEPVLDCSYLQQQRQINDDEIIEQYWTDAEVNKLCEKISKLCVDLWKANFPLTKRERKAKQRK